MNRQTFRLLRQAAGYTQRDLAAELGVSHVLISLMEKGDRRITEAIERKFRKVVGVTVDSEITANQLTEGIRNGRNENFTWK